MKMTFQIKHTRHDLFGGKSTKTLLIFLLILVFIFGIFQSTHSLIVNIFSPFLKGGDYFYKNISQILESFSSKNKLVEENKNLSNQIENDRIGLIDYESIKSENESLRETLKLKPAGNFITAAIIAKSPQIPLDSLFLNKGSNDGLSNGDLVLASDRILIGKIVKISKNQAIVALNSFAGVVSYGYVARTSEPMEINGSGGSGIETKVPIDFDIEVGDKISVAGTLTYVAAVVGVIQEDKSSGFKNVFMSLPVDIAKINMVFVESIIKD
jgi:cell shape-determining protein MreC